MRIDPKVVSPSRVQALAECGLKFEFRYVEGLRPPRVGSRILFGNVLHKARELWCVDRRQDMVPLVKEAWSAEGEKDEALGRFLDEYARLSLAARHLADEIKRARPDVVRVRATKEWKESALAAEIAELVGTVLDGVQGSVWAFSKSDPLPSLYDESIALAAAYARRWRHLPPASYSEFSFGVEWEGYKLSGKIDEITLYERPQGRPFYGVVDAKTYRDEHPFAAKNIDQGVAYEVAVEQLVAEGRLDLDPSIERLYGIDAMRMLEYRWFRIDERNKVRYRRELHRYEKAIEAGAFLSNAARCDADLCGFRGICLAYHAVPEETDVDEWFNAA